MKRMVFFHKTPAAWNKSKNFAKSPSTISSLEKMKGNYPKFTPSSEMKEFFETDIYFQMCKQICSRMGIKELHIVHGFMETEGRNWSVYGQKGQCMIDQMSTYWCVMNPEDLLGFMDSSIVFTRGNYPILHQWMEKNHSPLEKIWIHYPATSLRFPHLETFSNSITKRLKNLDKSPIINNMLTGMCIEHEINIDIDLKSNQELFTAIINKLIAARKSIHENPYNIVLVDDQYNAQTLAEMFPNSMIQKFVKPALWGDGIILHARKYDLIYCGTTLQETKNLQAFIQLMKYLDLDSERKLKIVIAGNKKGNAILASFFSTPFSNLEIINKGEVSRKELQSLFTQSKVMLVTSGRDANPRIIQESLVQGARVIAINTLSDGLEFLSANPLLGSVIDSDVEKWSYSRNGNLEFRPTVLLASQISDEIQKSDYPDLVAKISRKRLSIEECISPLYGLLNSFK